MFEICPEHQLDAPAVEQLLDSVFGPNRFSKASYAVRRNVMPIQDLSFIARADDGLIGTIRFWPITVKDMLCGDTEQALLLGPLAVSGSARGQNVGASLVWHALNEAEKSGFRRILLVGDMTYYGRFGFRPTLPNYITLPGGRDARRLLVRQSALLLSLPAVGKVEPYTQCGFMKRNSIPVAAE
ncbi:GNAT family N-acetyltransferase [Kordiimonas aquimaris]|uniref:GNAT family N-acetyltransferase n=1 Tax=Kordiimonas aquimaris TaxID=707591 RepID=UPI0021CF1816|nr:N-acetyltransferase [Kordiimonas aquimaris]